MLVESPVVQKIIPLSPIDPFLDDNLLFFTPFPEDEQNEMCLFGDPNSFIDL